MLPLERQEKKSSFRNVCHNIALYRVNVNYREDISWCQ